MDKATIETLQEMDRVNIERCKQGDHAWDYSYGDARRTCQNCGEAE